MGRGRSQKSRKSGKSLNWELGKKVGKGGKWEK